MTKHSLFATLKLILKLSDLQHDAYSYLSNSTATFFCGWHSYPQYPYFLRCFSELQVRALRDALAEACDIG